ncbi:MAG TPA: energy-coupling factor ABC transporter ATP-binding protein [Clostridia bacterium]|nr:energy-coupling factor ABC transporter ATP-binding protein [Clostridia bacterium]
MMGEPIVDIRNLSFTYSGSFFPALEGINLQVDPGQFLTITGFSGCGKSTLALCLAGFIPHAYPGEMKGVVHIQGRNTRDYPTGGLAGIVGLVQQDPENQLCTLTVQDEVAFGPENLRIPPEEIRKRVYFALETVGGLDLIDRKVHTLSGGEKQRVAIASVLAMNPALLILDEPTAHLDPSCTREVLQTLKKLREEYKTSIIVIEHRLERLVDISDRLLVMDRGKITESGSAKEFRHSYVPSGGWVAAAPVLEQEKSFCSIEKDVEREPLLTVENLRAGYRGREVLSGISFSADPGEILAIMGDNGSGKTTLLLALLGLLKATEGTIYLAGEDIAGRKVARRARDMGLTFQNPNHQIFESTVFQEAELPSLFLRDEAAGEREGKIKMLLKHFGLLQYVDQNPFTLSLGEKKRLALVSVLAYSPRVLILDEPLVGQDSHRLDLLMWALREHRARGGLTLMVCHEPALVASCCQRILFLEAGKLIIDGPVGQALERLALMGRKEYLPPGYERPSEEERR